jgi:uncharacterized protein (TIGR02452 family)
LLFLNKFQNYTTDDDGSTFPEPICVAMISSPAVNAGVIRERIPDTVIANMLIASEMHERMRRILMLALKRGHETLILGAFGCGVFKNNAADVACLFKSLLENEFR